MKICVFLGPTMAVEDAKGILPDAVYLPPAAQADILSAMTIHRPDVIALIDGVFGQSLSVWHKEILFALSRGVAVYGASSMGALRAAECHGFGMIPVGEVARQYIDGRLTGDDDWRWDNVLPDFKKHEDFYKGADDLHGAGGEWRVERQRLRWDILDAFAQAAQQAGIPHTEDFNRGSNEGVGYFQVNQRDGWRWNTAKAFLRPTCYGRPNFEMWTNAHVKQLRIEAQHVDELEFFPFAQAPRAFDGFQAGVVRHAAQGPAHVVARVRQNELLGRGVRNRRRRGRRRDLLRQHGNCQQAVEHRRHRASPLNR